jgi:murein DD-endopeptidase MepM/ murein hydrolase activator NlpD
MNNRVKISALLVAIIIPLTITTHALVRSDILALISPTERQKAVDNLDQALNNATSKYRSGRLVKASDEEMTEAKSKLEALNARKNDLEETVNLNNQVLNELEERYGITMLLHGAGGGRGSVPSASVELPVIKKSDSVFGSSAFVSALDLITGKTVKSSALRSSYIALHDLLASARVSALELPDQEKELRSANKEISKLELVASGRISADQVDDERRAEIKRVFEEVHNQVMRMQGELARIDAKMRAKAERKLIEKGLIAPKPSDGTSGVVPFTPSFVRPAYGPVTATFMQPSYFQVFGIPHRGMDIAIAQGSPIVASADGVVFLARDGGQRGYSYVLIGHRGGYATLYGHLSSISVSTGQDIRAGQVIGLSGGRPGSYGAGPTTTGPHLHFEVIKGGVHVNPKSVLN